MFFQYHQKKLPSKMDVELFCKQNFCGEEGSEVYDIVRYSQSKTASLIDQFTRSDLESLTVKTCNDDVIGFCALFGDANRCAADVELRYMDDLLTWNYCDDTNFAVYLFDETSSASINSLKPFFLYSGEETAKSGHLLQRQIPLITRIWLERLLLITSKLAATKKIVRKPTQNHVEKLRTIIITLLDD
jgi:hypothetical protein